MNPRDVHSFSLFASKREFTSIQETAVFIVFDKPEPVKPLVYEAPKSFLGLEQLSLINNKPSSTFRNRCYERQMKNSFPLLLQGRV